MGVIHTFAFCPKTSPGTFVIMVDASMFIKTEGVPDGIGVSVNDGAAKDFGTQSFKKNPIVLAMGGSTAGMITTLSPPTLPFPELSVEDFLQDPSPNTM